MASDLPSHSLDPERNASTRRARSALRDFFEVLVVAVVCALFVRTYIVQGYKVPSSSMEGGLVPGDHILVNKFVHSHLRHGQPPLRVLPIADVERGDVVVFRYPPNPTRDLVKRCLGLPGDRLEVRPGPPLLINGKTAREPYRLGVHGTAFGPYRVPEKHYFCLGDHRSQSSDSRAWGPVPENVLRGRAWLIYWSIAPEGRTAIPQDSSAWGRMNRIGQRLRWERFFRVIR